MQNVAQGDDGMHSGDGALESHVEALLNDLRRRGLKLTDDNAQFSKEISNTLVRFLDSPTDLRQNLAIPGKTTLGAIATSFLTWSTFAFYAIFLLAWSEFDILLEILIMRQLNINEEENSIVCGILQHGAKMQILSSLLSRDENNNDIINILRKAQEAAARNTFAHSFFHVTDKQSAKEVGLFYREVKTDYTVKKREFNLGSIVRHTAAFGKLVTNIKDKCNVTNDDISNYKKSIANLEPVHSSRALHRRQSKTNSRQAKTR